jgi:hypothetical protein
MCSRKGNVMMMMEIQSKADAVKQEGRTVEEYASELKYLWGELDHYAPLQMETPNDAQTVQKWVEDRRVTQFLRGLNPEFEQEAAICHQDSLPSLEDAISAMVQEEVRLRVMGSSNPVRSAYTIADDRDCYNCGIKGHLSYYCPQPRTIMRVSSATVEAGVVAVVAVVMVVLVEVILEAEAEAEVVALGPMQR